MGRRNSIGYITVTGSASNVQNTASDVIPATFVGNLSAWTIICKNTSPTNACTAVRVLVSNDLTETAASIVDWFNLNGDIPDGSLAVVIPGTLAATTTAMFAGVSPNYVTRWVRLAAKGGANTAAAIHMRASLHGIYTCGQP